MTKCIFHIVTLGTLIVGICLAAAAPVPQSERELTNIPIIEPIVDIVAKIVLLLTGLLGEILNLLLIGGLLESLLALGNEDPDGRRR